MARVQDPLLQNICCSGIASNGQTRHPAKPLIANVNSSNPGGTEWVSADT
jgi:hypothetical protein